MNKRKLMFLIVSILAVTIGITYAYYSASVQGTGNTNAEASANTATIGEVEFNGENTFDTTNIGRDIYPGFIGVQSFTVGPYKDGSGIYEIDLQADVPAAFNNDIKLTIYKTTDATNNNIDSEEGALTVTNNRYVKQDTLITNGSLTKVYEGALTNTNDTRLEQVEFTIESNAFTTPSLTPDGYYTYYTVYEYLDNGNQNEQQGLDFNSKITVKYVEELANLAKETLASLQELNYSLTVIPDSIQNPDFSKVSPKISAGIKYGVSVNPNNYITYASDFTYDDTTGIYTLTNPTTCQWSACYANTDGMFAVAGTEGVGQADSTPLTDSSLENVNVEMIQIDNPTASGADITFYEGAELNNVKNGTWEAQASGLYELQDDYGTSYYFRGDVDNNYVKFAGFYWRIIRINGDGSIRMIYAGDEDVIDALANKSEVLANGYDDSSTQYTQIGTSAFNYSYNDNASAGYMYGTFGSDTYEATHTNTNNSTIKTYIDTWYENNLKNTTYESFIADSIFCNDRSIGSDELIEIINNKKKDPLTNADLSILYTSNAFGDNSTIYGAYGRLIEQNNLVKGNKATLKCSNKNDRFTVSDTTLGNGALSYPIGLITIDEANIAGGNIEDNEIYYLRTGNLYWTGSPGDSRDGYVGIMVIDSAGIFFHRDSIYKVGVRPVINLKPGSLVDGDGTINDAFLTIAKK